MGYIKSGLFISLDGVIESPETWHFPYFDEQMGAVVGELMSVNDATLLGRQTYDEFAGYWPNADPGDPMTGVMNGAQVRRVEFADRGGVGELVGDQRRRGGRADQAQGRHPPRYDGQRHPGAVDARAGPGRRATPARYPIVVGHGKKLFADGATVPLKLVSSTTFGTGVLHLVYAADDAQAIDTVDN